MNEKSPAGDEMLAVITAAIRAYEAKGAPGPKRTYGARSGVTSYGANEPHPLIRSVCGPFETGSGIPAINSTVRNCD